MDQKEIAERVYKIAHSPRNAAKAVDVGVNKIYGWMNDGSLPAKKDGQRTIITDENLRAKVESLPDYSPSRTEAENAESA
jgi:hypothetical protein